MSSKFSNTSQVQKPPHICIKPPPGPEYVPPPLVLQPIQGYVEYFDPGSPSEGGMASQIDLLPNAPLNVWIGYAEAHPYRIDLIMTAGPDQSWISFDFAWHVYDVLEDVILTPMQSPRSWAPFDSGQVEPADQPDHGRAAWHLWF